MDCPAKWMLYFFWNESIDIPLNSHRWAKLWIFIKGSPHNLHLYFGAPSQHFDWEWVRHYPTSEFLGSAHLGKVGLLWYCPLWKFKRAGFYLFFAGKSRNCLVWGFLGGGQDFFLTPNGHFGFKKVSFSSLNNVNIHISEGPTLILPSAQIPFSTLGIIKVTSAQCAIFYQQKLTKRRRWWTRGFFMVSDIGSIKNK